MKQFQVVAAILGVAFVLSVSCAANNIEIEVSSQNDLVTPAVPLQGLTELVKPAEPLEHLPAEVVSTRAVRPAARPSEERTYAVYTVKQGDTLSLLSTTFGVSVDTIAETNGLVDLDVIRTGEAIWIPGGVSEAFVRVVDEQRRMSEGRRVADEAVRERLTDSQARITELERENARLKATLALEQAEYQQELSIGEAKIREPLGPSFWRRLYPAAMMVLLLVAVALLVGYRRRGRLLEKARMERADSEVHNEELLVRNRHLGKVVKKKDILLEESRRYLYFLKAPSWLRHKRGLKEVPFPLWEGRVGAVRTAGSSAPVGIKRLLAHLSDNKESRHSAGFEFVEEQQAETA